MAINFMPKSDKNYIKYMGDVPGTATDLNNLKTTGIYYTSNKVLTNAPPVYSYHYIEVMNNGFMTTQKLSAPNSGVIYTREYSGSPASWSSWKTISSVEHGSNANGNYIKFDDGTLICYNQVGDTYSITQAWQNWYEVPANSTAGTTTFPVAFIDIPKLAIAQVWNNNGGVISDVKYDKNGISKVNWRRPNSATSALEYCYIAIGKWK